MLRDVTVRVFIGFEEMENCLLSKGLGVRREGRGTREKNEGGKRKGREKWSVEKDITGVVFTWKRGHEEEDEKGENRNRNKNKNKNKTRKRTNIYKRKFKNRSRRNSGRKTERKEKRINNKKQ